MSLDWDKITERAGVAKAAPQQKVEQDNIKDFVSFTASKKAAKPAALPEKSFIDKSLEAARATVNAPIRGILDNSIATRLDAFGQFDLADEVRGISQEYFPKAADAPKFGELPTAGFVGEAFGENVPDIGLTVAVAAIPYVGLPAAGALIYSSLYGESRREIKEGTGEDNPTAALAPATFNTALELNPIGRIMERVGIKNAFTNLFRETVKADSKSPLTARLKDVSSFAAGTAVREGIVETAQWASNAATVRVLTDKSIFDKLSTEDKDEAWASFFGGFGAGAGIGAGAAVYSQYQGGKARSFLENQQSELDALAEAIQASQAPNKAAQGARIQAGLQAATVNPESTEASPAVSPATNANVQASDQLAETLVPNASDSQPSPSDIADAKQEKINEIASRINSLPQADRQQAITALEARLQETRTALQMLNDQLSAGEVDTSEQVLEARQASESNLQVSRRLSTPEIAYTPKEDFNRVNLIQGNVLKSSIPVNNYDIDLTDGLMITADQSVDIQPIDVQMAESAWSLIDDLGLGVNAITNEPMRLIFEFHKNLADNTDAQFSVMDSSTYIMRIADNARSSPSKFFETMIHEVGHLLAVRALSDSTAKQRELLFREWSNDIAQAQTKGQMFDRFMPGYRKASSRKDSLKQSDRENYGITSYPTSLSEYLAEQFALSASNSVTKGQFNLKTDLPEVYKLLNTYAKSAYVRATKSFGDAALVNDSSSRSRFSKFVDRMLLGKQVKEMQSRLDQMKKGQAESNSKSSNDMLKEAAPVKETIELTEGKLYNIDPDSDGARLIEFLGKMGLNNQAQNVAEVIDINMGFIGDNWKGKVSRKLLTPLQMAEQAGNKGFHLGTAYIEEVQKMQATKMKMLEKADTFLREWQAFGTDGSTRISKMAYEVSTKSDELGRRLTPDELLRYQNVLKLSPEEFAAWQRMDTIFQEAVTNIEAGMLYDAAKTYIPNKADAKNFRDRYMAESDPDARNKLIEEFTGKPLVGVLPTDALTNPLWDSIEQIKSQANGMRQKNYFPRSRMGEYSVKITAVKDKEWEGYKATRDNETVGFYSFDSKSEQDAFLKEIAPDMGNGLKAIGYKMDSQVFSVMGLPAGIIEQIKREVPNLNAKQLAQLDDIAMQRSPGRKFLRHLTKRRGIAGYSQDAMRVFANYMSSSANHLARTEHSSDISAVLAEMDSQIKQMPGDAVQVRDLNVIRDYFVKHFDYLMKPDSDWARLRAVGFLWYLGFNVKSAAVNLMQTPMVLYPVLTKATSDANAIRRITGAMKDSVAHIRTGKKLTGGELQAIDEMIKLGLIDQSFATELAGMAEADALKRLVPGWDMKATLDKVSWYGGGLFRIGEKFNRYVAAIAAYRVAMDNKLSQEEAITFVRDTIQGSQFEYSRWNRAEFMRGKQSVLFLFWQYMQHASYLAFGGKGSKIAQRMWVLALVIAGIEGLPFADMIFGILDYSGTQAKKLLGHENPRVALRQDLRELITHIYDRPDDIMKGLSYQYGLGPLHALGLLGVPVPQVSTRGSLSYGNPVPWFDASLDPTTSKSEALYAKTFAAVAGPVGGMVLSAVEAVMSKEVDSWKRWEKVLPTFMQNASTGVRWQARGQETNTAQASILTFTTPEQRAEAVAKSLGFQPTRLDQTRQQIRASQIPILLAQQKREAFLKQLDYAVRTKNREGKKDILEGIKRYNAELRKEPEMRPFIIDSDTIRNSLSGRARRRAEMEKGIRHGKDGILLERKIKELYPVTSGE